MANVDLGNIDRMVNNTVTITVSDLALGELNEKTVETCPNSLIVSAPQYNGKDMGYYGICASDYRGNIVSLIPFNKLNTSHFQVKKSDKDESKDALELELNWTYVITNPIKNSYMALMSAINTYVARIDEDLNRIETFGYTSHAELNNRISNEKADLENTINDKYTYSINFTNAVLNSLIDTINQRFAQHIKDYHSYNGTYNNSNNNNNIYDNTSIIIDDTIYNDTTIQTDIRSDYSEQNPDDSNVSGLRLNSTANNGWEYTFED